MKLRNYTLFLAVVCFIAFGLEVLGMFKDSGNPVFSEYPIMFVALGVNGLFYFMGYCLFSRGVLAKQLMILAAIISIVYVFFYLYLSAQIHFDGKMGFVPWIIFLWLGLYFLLYIRDVLCHQPINT
ncbi:hypothetical protein [Gilvimarinus chinensis]|uniref:hypothetical protein n=1 Tax=Gilvimarinus chinensis TaxID=396005 RepID=UPI0003827E4F|nr:hypothetical protein [Gilvimarinus chinensis]